MLLHFVLLKGEIHEGNIIRLQFQQMVLKKERKKERKKEKDPSYHQSGVTKEKKTRLLKRFLFFFVELSRVDYENRLV